MEFDKNALARILDFGADAYTDIWEKIILHMSWQKHFFNEPSKVVSKHLWQKYVAETYILQFNIELNFLQKKQ